MSASSGSARSFSPAILERLLAREDLDEASVEEVFGAILDGALTGAQIGAFAIALRAKGETPTEIAAAARALRSRASMVRPRLAAGAPLVDTCGTGGDGTHTFNVSTVAAIVVAGCGVTVAKHGNRAVSSRAGSADLVEALGLPLEGEAPAFDERLARSMEENNLTFLFAPRHHSALRHAAAVRRELGVRTVFNLLGPIANPAGATHQLVGVFEDRRRAVLCDVLRLLGGSRAWVVHGEPCEGAPRGLDEVSPSGPTRVTELCADGTIRERVITPEDAGLERVSLQALRGGDAADNATIARAILAGERGAARTAVVLNVACALVVAGTAADLREGRERAEAAIDRGDASSTLERWRAFMTA
ncbi:MAG: anthranilate phosphoribosyltransferase [Polyangiales bacterium]